jgi:hypothetical protein
MLARRLLLLIAALFLATALASGLRSDRAAAPEDPPPEAVLPRTEPRGEAPRTVRATLAHEAGAAPVTVRARVGDRVIIRVASQSLDQVEIGEGVRVDAVEPGSPARFDFIADRPGVLPIRLRRRDAVVGTLAVREHDESRARG